MKRNILFLMLPALLIFSTSFVFYIITANWGVNWGYLIGLLFEYE